MTADTQTAEAPDLTSTVGVVVIGRNEGERLVACLDSLALSGVPIVYVDSGSTDGSVAAAEQAGATVVLLDQDIPFTAGRARNAGFRRLLQVHPNAKYVQFVDGDCKVEPDWLAFASGHLRDHADHAIVCGRRKELHPERSVFNRLCDFEWDTPVGIAEACGGDFMAVVSAFADVGGFNDGLIAGEEPELCFRLRQQGWKIYRADQPMTLHDAALTRLGQWARRATRAGYAYAARGALHWRAPGGLCRRENLRIVFWAAALPLAALAGAALLSPYFLLLLLAYPLQFFRLRQQVSAKDRGAPATQFAALLLLGKWPEFKGQLMFLQKWARGAEQTLIEYK